MGINHLTEAISTDVAITTTEDMDTVSGPLSSYDLVAEINE